MDDRMHNKRHCSYVIMSLPFLTSNPAGVGDGGLPFSFFSLFFSPCLVDEIVKYWKR
uniref:Uncharacterized protein n=1 Tax=Octopus bimaculoides TaxID=37653 RepID=A0A0L8GDI5_OCTBM